MRSLLNRVPALLLLQTFLIFLIGCERGLPVWLALAVGELVLFAEVLLGESRWEPRKLCFALLLAALAAFLSPLLCAQLARDMAIPHEISGTFTVAERRHWGHGELLRLMDSGGTGWAVDATGDLQRAREGDRYFLRAKIVPFSDKKQSGAFSPLKYWRARGVLGTLRGVRGVERQRDEFSIHSVRQFLRERIARLPQHSGAIVAAVLLGDRDENLREDFRRWGLSHILAVSGWHVSLALVLGCFLFGSGRRGLPLCSLLLWGYCLLSGASMSAARASVMIQIGLAGLYAGCRVRALNSAGVAGILMLLWNPYAAYDLGWQMSVLSVVAVTALADSWRNLSVLISSPLMWFLTSPLSAPIAGGTYFSSLPVNAMASVLFAFIVGFVLLASVPALLGLNGYYFSLPAELLLRGWAAAADQWVEWFPRSLPVNYFPAWLCAGTVYFIVSRAAKLSLWRCAALALMGGCVVTFFR